VFRNVVGVAFDLVGHMPKVCRHPRLAVGQTAQLDRVSRKNIRCWSSTSSQVLSAIPHVHTTGYLLVPPPSSGGNMLHFVVGCRTVGD
jgi:hypothetical protein